jgi:hypothetical protein
MDIPVEKVAILSVMVSFAVVAKLEAKSSVHSASKSWSSDLRIIKNVLKC